MGFLAAGTDSDQVAPYNPFVSLRWLLNGKVIDGTPMRGPEELPSREEALRMYSLDAAWFTSTNRGAARSNPANMPTSRCCPTIT
jgi:predicted amidohydrolase YtcJ